MMRIGLALLWLAACGGDDGGGPDAGNPSTDAHQRCVDLTNQLRATVGRPPVVRSAELEAYANEGAEYDHARSPHAHFSSTQGGGIAFAENECPHWDIQFGGGTVLGLMEACIDAFWSEGPGSGPGHGHYNNMIGNYGSLGCGIYTDGTDYTIIQDFGN